MEVEEVVEATVDSNPIPMEPRVHAPAGAFASLDDVNLNEVFELRAESVAVSPVRPQRNLPNGDQGFNANNH